MIIKFELVDGILLGPYPENSLIDLPLAKQIVKERLDFVGGKSYPALIDTAEVAGITKDARDYFSSEEAVKGISIARIFPEISPKTFPVKMPPCICPTLTFLKTSGSSPATPP